MHQGSDTPFPQNCCNTLVEKFSKPFFKNWLQVLASTKLSEIDEREGEKFEPEVTGLFGLKA